ncbi:putative dehydrogenase [Paucimonas lemoignei]|uniref:Putative dehydrogenase n=1 Tax=Paucimonas lemoignei TaxID=29443 RepID=A0A4R3HR89_PAULE|nr:Gfo/Idh/MocA family oxidoreductase [Paucimonas lemoignei]TCS35096.1 putative dehydrogenase [Paucimonas lemoignei]
MAEKFLIVSLGSIGRRHLANLRLLRPNAEIAVLRLHSNISSEAVPDGVNIQFASIDEALAFQPNAAVLAGPASTRLPLMRTFAEAGIPMFLEKPISNTLTGLQEVLQYCSLRKLPLMTGYNLRFLPSLKKVKCLLDDGCIGRVLAARAEVGQYLPDWRPTSRYQDTVSARKSLGGGALLELSHEIDYLYWFFGLPAAVSASGGRYSSLDIDVEDLVSLNLEYADESRRLVSVHLDFLQRAPTRTCKFIGTEGTLVWNGLSDTIDLYSAATRSWSSIGTAVGQSDRNRMYIDELAHFLACLEESDSILIDGAQAYDVLAIIEAAKRSIQEQTRVKVHGYALC